MLIIADYSRSDPRHGYVLLVTLVLLTLAATAAVTVSRAAIERVQAASESEIQLQNRWGTLSCQVLVLANAETVLRDAEIRLKEPVASWQDRLTLGGLAFDLTVSDESAKANAGMLIQRQGREQAALSIRRLSLGNSDIAGSVHLRSSANGSPRCFGDLFDVAAPQMLMKGDLGSPPAALITCWGNGSLNIHRAPQAAMQEILVGVLDASEVEQLAELQQSNPTISVAEALKKLQLTQQNQAMAGQLLADGSNCYSLWINCRTARRSFWTLAIADDSHSLVGRMSIFQW